MPLIEGVLRTNGSAQTPFPSRLTISTCSVQPGVRVLAFVLIGYYLYSAPHSTFSLRGAAMMALQSLRGTDNFILQSE
jgi:hypothetical protein